MTDQVRRPIPFAARLGAAAVLMALSLAVLLVLLTHAPDARAGTFSCEKTWIGGTGDWNQNGNWSQ